MNLLKGVLHMFGFGLAAFIGLCITRSFTVEQAVGYGFIIGATWYHIYNSQKNRP